MPIKRVVSYDSFDLTANGVHAGIAADDLFSTWRNDLDERSRPGAHPAIGAVAMSARRVTVDLTFPSGASAQTINTAFQTLMGGLQPDKPYDPENPRYLVAQLADGSDTPVRRPAVIEGPLEALSGGVNGFRVVFVSADPAWRLVTPADADLANITGNETVTWQTLSLPNNGQARAWPVLNFAVDTAETTGLHKYVRTILVANNNDQDMIGEAILLELGDTTTWVSASGGATSNGSNVYVFREGIEQRRDLIAFNTAYTLMWVYVEHLAAGESMTLEVVYGGTGTTPLQLTGTYRPAFDNRGEDGTLTTGSTTTVMNVAGSPGWDTDQWKDGKVRIISGALAGQERNISASGSASITVSTAWGSSPVSGVAFVVWNSRNDRLVWRVSVNERGDPYRGLWRLNTHDTKPSDVRFDAPGCWEHHLFLENNDVFNQTDFAWLEASSDFDPYAILDADRCGQGVTQLLNSGAADGIAFHSIWPLTQWHFDGQFKNPNGMCEAFFGSREDETRDWTEVRSVTTATDATTLTAFSAVDNALATDTRHLVAAVLPIDGASIGPTWARDTGSRTSGGAAGTNTFTDGTKTGRWVNGQFDDATVVIVSGTGAGQRRLVSSTTDAGLVTTVNNWTEALDDTSRYEIINSTLVATVRTNTRWYVERDVTDLSIGTISAQALNYPANMILGIDSGTTGTDYPYYRLRIGQEDRVLFLDVDDVLVLDCPNKKAVVEFGSGSERDVTAYVVSEYVRSATDITLTDEWLPLTPGSHSLKILNSGMATFDLDVDLSEGYLG
jgi:hypothetical protein